MAGFINITVPFRLNAKLRFVVSLYFRAIIVFLVVILFVSVYSSATELMTSLEIDRFDAIYRALITPKYYFFWLVILLSIFTISILFSRFVDIRSSFDEPKYDIGGSAAALERDFGSQLDTLRREFEETAKREVQKASERISTTLDDRISKRVEDKVDNTIGDDVVTLVGKRVAKSAEEYAWRLQMREDLTDRFNTSRNRIDELATKAERAAYVFRWIGIVLALTGLALAGWKFVSFLLAGSVGISAEQWKIALVSHATTTLPVVLLAEALALIMFRYQSRSLEQMRYFANEVTTLSLRFAAALIIAQQGTKKDIVEFAKEMARQERNFILKKGEATLETVQNAGEDALVQKVLDKMSPKPSRTRRSTTNGEGANKGTNGN